ncbi:hypothetical protein LMH87_003783 [Akanthomyces muscarius]|uniref:Zn(2)-C6 fungal-type domain-containing protein n=1 Tax=Akanthomyces muscarius TaxID=2231603 RepID=A0A9W8UGF7_AKAMU|nr:hypothetical protein LMH87_003783 [Akanthomyces muscarius]KAJ4144916.1 hypothetical protein LMH87_003783 [Akanthomyces muscarius]
MSSIGVPPRRKQWAPRVRTGCHTCRLRRIKCDETQPVCKRCLAGGRDCQYSLVWRPPNGDESGTQARSNAIRYYTTVVYPQAVRTLASNTYKQTMDPRLHISNQTSPPAFIMLQMSHRISTLCQQNSALTRQHAVPDMAILWRTFYVYMGQSITLLNHYITNRSPIALTLFRVIDFICAGLVIAELPWRTHTRGFLTLVQHHGSVQAVLNSSDLPDILPALQFVLLTATMANTTSPSTDQISQLYDWTDGQCLSVFAFSFSGLKHIQYPHPKFPLYMPGHSSSRRYFTLYFLSLRRCPSPLRSR